ncbi:hypothetical protein CHS0354_028338 [Potamilus streckersoni]|uniref:Uncharacterized protein n=1 Tax=Potamilus streckersoni TaxID=2493646 RepID=A0AAE0VJ44_9BIVA|nr:hypothetical protein CHS0354_028338 [Potamilus streckersoni]
MGVKQHGPLYFNCHENPCLWGYQFCDRVIRRCLACDLVSSACHTPRQQFNCTLYCDEVTRSKETLTIERCDDVYQLLYVSIGINVLFAFILVLVVYLLRLEIKAAIKYFNRKLRYRNQRPECHARPQDGERFNTNKNGTELPFQQADRDTTELPGKIERSDETSRLNDVECQRVECAESQNQEERQQPNIHQQHYASAAGNVRGELQSRLPAGNSHTHACLPPGRHIPPATADTGYNSGNGIKDRVSVKH